MRMVLYTTGKFGKSIDMAKCQGSVVYARKESSRVQAFRFLDSSLPLLFILCIIYHVFLFCNILYLLFVNYLLVANKYVCICIYYCYIRYN